MKIYQLLHRNAPAIEQDRNAVRALFLPDLHVIVNAGLNDCNIQCDLFAFNLSGDGKVDARVRDRLA